MDKINPKDCQVLSLGEPGFLQFFRVVSSDEMANPEGIPQGGRFEIVSLVHRIGDRRIPQTLLWVDRGILHVTPLKV